MAMYQFIIAHPWVVAVVLLWTLPWKGVALWRAARRAHLGWFVALLVLNTFAILEIVYIVFFSGRKQRTEAALQASAAGPVEQEKRLIVI